MTRHISGAFRVALFALVAGALVACGLPRSGPNKREVYSGAVQNEGDAFIVESTMLWRGQPRLSRPSVSALSF